MKHLKSVLGFSFSLGSSVFDLNSTKQVDKVNHNASLLTLSTSLP